MSVEAQVSFLVAGVQKGGTTALFDFLREQGGVRLPERKELHFFDDDDVDWARPDYDAYHAAFDSGAGPAGEATPIYIYWPQCLERIFAYNPAMKFVILLRDPVERAWSHWRMEYARGAETAPFSWCIRQGRRRLLESRPWGHHREFSYVERGFYGEQLERLIGLFGPEQVRVFRSEDLDCDPATVLAEVRRFIGAPPAPAPQPRRVHVGREMDYGSELTTEDAAFLRSLYARDAERLRTLTGAAFS